MSIKTGAAAADQMRELSVTELEAVTGGCLRLPFTNFTVCRPRLIPNPLDGVVRSVASFLRRLF